MKNRRFYFFCLIVYLRQKADAKIEECSDDSPAGELPPGVACAFNWDNIVDSPSHPCSDQNLFGFKNEEPCVLVKLNKVFDFLYENQKKKKRVFFNRFMVGHQL
jgi:hypothetical protein